MLKAVAVPYFAMICMLVVFGTGAPAEDVFPAPPRLATTPAELVALRASPTFGMVREQAVKAADALLADLPVVPTGEGNWTFYYLTKGQ